MNNQYIGVKTIPFYDGTTRRSFAVSAASANLLLPRVPAGNSGNLNPIAAPGAATVALAGAGAGNVDNGDHKYMVTLLTIRGRDVNGDFLYGETLAGTPSATVTVADKTVNGKVALSAIPTGSVLSVVGRRVYRSKVGSLTAFYLLHEILDNTTTTYTDNTADSGLGALHVEDDTSYPHIVWRRPSQLLLDTTTRCYFGFGVTAPTITSDYEVLEAGERRFEDVPQNALYIAAIRATADGTLGFSYTALYMDVV